MYYGYNINDDVVLLENLSIITCSQVDRNYCFRADASMRKGGVIMKDIREEAIIQLVQARLNQNKLTGGETIYVTLEEDSIVLIGSCDREEQKIAAETIVSGTCGVTKYISRIKVRKIKQSI